MEFISVPLTYCGNREKPMPVAKKTAAWEQRLAELLPLYGHRNWIVVADSAYPAQSRPGIETVFTGCDQLTAVRKVYDAITESTHIRANIFVDQELAAVAEHDAAGVLDYRGHLERLLGPSVRVVPHEQVIAGLDEAAQVFRVLILKTTMTIPYTSVFFQLDCGYWSADAEKRLRKELRLSKGRK
jgi:D-ribose pyranose/furanose isomerase RbsD